MRTRLRPGCILSGGRWLTLRGSPDRGPALAQHRDIAVTIEDTSPAERAGLFARAHGLSVREGELLGHLVRGVDTRDLARLMFLSQHTVQDHLKSIFAKTSVHSRRHPAGPRPWYVSTAPGGSQTTV